MVRKRTVHKINREKKITNVGRETKNQWGLRS